MKVTGGCACGAVRYELAGSPIFVNNCHCTLCQRQSGGTSAVNAVYESDRVRLVSGTLTSHQVKTGSGGMQTILRCAGCGTAVWSHYPRLGRHGTAVRVGTFDNSATVRPDAIIFTADALPWVNFPADIPGFAQTYDARTLLPPERMARLSAVAAHATAEKEAKKT